MSSGSGPTADATTGIPHASASMTGSPAASETTGEDGRARPADEPDELGRSGATGRRRATRRSPCARRPARPTPDRPGWRRRRGSAAATGRPRRGRRAGRRVASVGQRREQRAEVESARRTGRRRRDSGPRARAASRTARAARSSCRHRRPSVGGENPGRGASGTTCSRSRRMRRTRRAARAVASLPTMTAAASRRSCARSRCPNRLTTVRPNASGSSHGARSSRVTTTGMPEAIGSGPLPTAW